jgi:hypothetical protein
MANPNKAKGDAWERSVMAYLAEEFGRQVRRPHQEGYKDVGDLHLSPFALQCKDVAGLSLPATIRAAELQAGHAEEPFGVVAHKVRRKNVADGTVSMSLRTFRAVAARLQEAEEDAAVWRATRPTPPTNEETTP